MVQVRYLITSGNSAVGLSVIKALAALGEKNIVAGARDVEKSRAHLQAAGASEVVHLDLYNVDSLKAAFKGVERALLVAGNPTGGPDDLALWAKNFAAAAKATPSVKLIARISAGGADINGQGVAKLQGLADNELRVSGIPWVTSGPNFFFDELFPSKRRH